MSDLYLSHLKVVRKRISRWYKKVRGFNKLKRVGLSTSDLISERGKNISGGGGLI